MASPKEIIEQVLAAHGDSRLALHPESFFNKISGAEADFYWIKSGPHVLYKIVIPKPVRCPYSIEEYHEDPDVICHHPVHKAYLLGPILAACLANSKETKAILERVGGEPTGE